MDASAIELRGGIGDQAISLDGLKEALPANNGPSQDELQDALADRRLLVVKLGVGVPLTAILAVGLSFLLHALLAGGIFAAGWWVLDSYGPHAIWASDNADGGEGFGGVVDVESGELQKLGLPTENAPAAKPPTAPQAAPVTDLAPAKLPDLPPPPPQSILATDSVALLGIGGGLQAPKEMKTDLSDPLSGTLTAKPSDTPPEKTTGAGLNLNIGPVVAAGGGTNDGDEESIDLMKPGVGRGKGKGRGNGNEIDRGASAANLEPQILNLGMPDLPRDLLVKVMGKKVEFDVTVGPDGKVEDVKVIASSGSAAADAICKDMVLRAKFRPGYDAGIPVRKVTKAGYDF